MKKQLPTNIIFILDKPEYPYLAELVQEIEALGICVRIPDKVSDGEFVPGENDYIISGCAEGAEMARQAGTGYMAFAEAGVSGEEFWDAECMIQGFEEVDADFVLKMYERARHIPWTILETERTIIRELTLDDIDDLYKLYAEPGLAEHIPPLCEDREEEVEFERMYIESMYGFYGYGIWVILDRETGEFIGRAGITGRDGYEDLEVGYILSRKYQHRGIATEVMKAIIQYAHQKFGCSKLNAFIDAANTASVRFAEKLGFKKRGIAAIEGRDMEWYVLETKSYIQLLFTE